MWEVSHERMQAASLQKEMKGGVRVPARGRGNKGRGQRTISMSEEQRERGKAIVSSESYSLENSNFALWLGQ